ncbi:MAG TPA: XRE family transcriptional regulator, partial [Marinobacter hydrocarbonoclasticus]|nr:XRE family transcriptional regulator [Marinobacter nauticus]
MNFGARVKQIREFRGMTQASLAQLIGSKQAVISALELRDSKTSD